MRFDKSPNFKTSQFKLLNFQLQLIWITPSNFKRSNLDNDIYIPKFLL